MDSSERIARKRKSCEMEGDDSPSDNHEEVIEALNKNQEIKNDTEVVNENITEDVIVKNSENVIIEHKPESVPELRNECSTADVIEVVNVCNTEKPNDDKIETACEDISDNVHEDVVKNIQESELIQDVAIDDDVVSNTDDVTVNVNEDDLMVNTVEDVENENDVNEDKHDDQPVITITFTGDNLNDYKPSFLNFLQAFPDLKIVDLNNVVQLFKCAASEVTSSNSKRSKRKKKKARKELFSIDEHTIHAGEDDEADSAHKRSKWELFVVDTNPTDIKEIERDRVKFSSKFKALDEDKEVKKEEEKTSGLGTCFNCDGNHSIRDCTEPKDFARIRQAKMNFRSSIQKLTRYHVDEEQSFSHLKPGKLSTKLRDALGLGKYELPPHVYKMRVLGYPPGWLEEAKIVHSNINLFDIEGKNIKEKASANKNFIDPEKVINYEGFNVKMDRGIRDQFYQYGVPPFSKNHAKESMISYINNMVKNMEDNLETCDMDIDASSDKEEDTTTKSPRISPTLTDLELKKKQLLVELVDTECNDSTESPITKDRFIVLDDSECETISENNVTANDSELNQQSLEDDSKDNKVMDSEINDSNTTPELSKQENGDSDPGPLKQVKKSMFGTPIIKSGSPYSRLPNPDNFMKDVSPVINFENLPNSTGKYEQMTGVLEKVRKTLKNIQEKT